MSTPAHVAHQSPGRIRLEIPSRRGDDTFFAALSKQVAQSNQVSRARGNARAASLVVEYSGALERLVDDFRRLELALASPPGTAVQLPAGWDARSMLLAGAAFGMVGVIQTVRGEVMMPALTAFWYAASALRLARIPAAAGSQADALRAHLSVP